MTATEQLLIEAAVQIVERDGAEALTFRSLGAEAGVSRSTPLLYFGDSAGMLAAVAAWGFRQLDDELGSVPQQLEDLALAYVGFALDHPRLHRAMHDPVLWDAIATASARPAPSAEHRSQVAADLGACFARFVKAAADEEGAGLPIERAHLTTALADGIIRQLNDEGIGRGSDRAEQLEFARRLFELAGVGRSR